MSDLPRPATVTDVYLHDIAASLRQLHLDLAQLVMLSTPQAGPIGEPDLINLREPELAQPARKKK